VQILSLKPKCTKFDFSWSSALDPAGELTTPPRRGKRGGQGRKEKLRGEENRGERRKEEGEGRGRES